MKSPAQKCSTIGETPVDDASTEFIIKTYEPSGQTLRKIAEFIELSGAEYSKPVIVITGSGKIGVYALTNLQMRLPI